MLRPRPHRRFLRAASRSLLALIILAAVAVGALSVMRHQSPLAIFTRPLAPAPQDVFHKSHLLVLVEGLDYDYTNNDIEYSSDSRSDVIWAVNLDFAHDRVYELSVPRDMEATLPNGDVAKINQAQSDGGTREAEAVISKWLGIPGFDRYVVLRPDTAKDFIDAIGGLNVDVENSDALMHRGPNARIDYDDNWGHLHIHLKPGLQHLNGAQAVGYMRFRHDWCSDPCRIMRQQEVLKALVAKLKGDKLNTLLHAGSLIAAFNKDVNTNFTPAEEMSIAVAFAGISPKAVATAQVPYTEDITLADGGDVIVPNVQARARMVQTMLVSPPVPTPTPDPAAVAAVAPSSVHVDVENGTGVTGLAGRVAELLKAKGFKIVHVGNAANANVQTTQLRQHSTIAYAAERVRKALGASGQRVRVDASASPAPEAVKSDVTLIVGEDLAGALGVQASTQQ